MYEKTDSHGLLETMEASEGRDAIKLQLLGISKQKAWKCANTRKDYWRISNSPSSPKSSATTPSKHWFSFSSQIIINKSLHEQRNCRIPNGTYSGFEAASHEVKFPLSWIIWIHSSSPIYCSNPKSSNGL